MAVMADVYEWNETKRQANLVKHGIDFLRMTEFDWAKAAVVADRRRDYGENRFRAYGMVGGSFCVVMFTRRAGAYRIISVRRGSRAERAKYEQGRA
jgi:uncharacterized DUF497 family protein